MSGFAPGSRAARLAMQSGNVRLAESDSDTDSVSSGGTAISNTLVATDSEEEAVGYDAAKALARRTAAANSDGLNLGVTSRRTPSQRSHRRITTRGTDMLAGLETPGTGVSVIAKALSHADSRAKIQAALNAEDSDSGDFLLEEAKGGDDGFKYNRSPHAFLMTLLVQEVIRAPINALAKMGKVSQLVSYSESLLRAASDTLRPAKMPDQWRALIADEVQQAAHSARTHLLRLKALATSPQQFKSEGERTTQKFVEWYQTLILGLATFDSATKLATAPVSTPAPAAPRASNAGGGGGCCGRGGAAPARGGVPSKIEANPNAADSATLRSDGYDSDDEVEHIVAKLPSRDRRSVLHFTPRQMLPLLLKMLVQEANPNMVVPDYVLAMDAPVDITSHSCNAAQASGDHMLRHKIKSSAKNLVYEYCARYRISQLCAEAYKLCIYGQNLRGALEQQKRRPQEAIVPYLIIICKVVKEVVRRAETGMYLRLERVLAIDAVEFVTRIFDEYLPSFRDLFWMNEPAGGLESFLTAYRYLYEAKEYFQPGQLAAMAPKLEQACVDSVKTVYKMKRAEVKKVTGEEEDVPEVKAGGGPARRATTGSREVVVSVKVVLPTHNIVTLMDGINGVQIASVARPDSVEAALNVAVGDIVTAVNGAGVAGLPAAEVMREIRRSRKNIALLVQGKRPRSQLTAITGDAEENKATDELATHLEVSVHSAMHLLGVGSSDALSYVEQVMSSKFKPYVLVRWANQGLDAPGAGGGGAPAGSGDERPMLAAASFREAAEFGVASPVGVGLAGPVWNGVGLRLSLNAGTEAFAQLLRVEVRDSPTDVVDPASTDLLLGMCDIIVTAPSPAFAMASRSKQTHLVPLCFPQAGTDVPEEPASFIFDGRKLTLLHNQARTAQDHRSPGLVKLALTLVRHKPRVHTSDAGTVAASTAEEEHVCLQGMVDLGNVVLTALTELRDHFWDPFQGTVGEFMSAPLMRLVATTLYSRLKSDLTGFLSHFKVSAGGACGVPTVFHVFDIIKAVHEVMTAKALAGPSSSMAAWVDPAAMIDLHEAFEAHVPSLVEGLRSSVLDVYLPRMQKQEQLVPISEVHRHTDAVQALFSLLLAFLTTFKTYCRGSKVSHVALFARRVVTEPFVIFGTYEFDQIVATLQQKHKGNPVYILASTEANTVEAERTVQVLGLRLNNIMVLRDRLKDVLSRLNHLEDFELRDDSSTSSDDDVSNYDTSSSSGSDDDASSSVSRSPTRADGAGTGSGAGRAGAGGAAGTGASAGAPAAGAGAGAGAGAAVGQAAPEKRKPRRRAGRTLKCYMLTLVVQRATGLPKMDTVAGMIKVAGDPYLVAKLAGSADELDVVAETCQTHCIKKSLAPVWEETFHLVSTSPGSVLDLSAFDWDDGADDEFIGGCRLSLGRFLDKGEVELECVLGNEGAVLPVDEFALTCGMGVPRGGKRQVFSSVVRGQTRGTLVVKLNYVTSDIGKPVMIGLTRRVDSAVERIAMVCIFKTAIKLMALFINPEEKVTSEMYAVTTAPGRQLQTSFVERQLKLMLPFIHDQLLLFKRHLYPKVFQRLVLKVWETVAFCMWNWLVPERPRHNYITERYMKVTASPGNPHAGDEVDTDVAPTAGTTAQKRGGIMTWLRKKAKSRKRRSKPDDKALQPHQVYIMKQAYPVLVNYFSSNNQLFPGSVLDSMAAPLYNVLTWYDVPVTELGRKIGQLYGSAIDAKTRNVVTDCKLYVDPATKLSYLDLRALSMHRSVYPSGKTEEEAVAARRVWEMSATYV